MIGPTCPMCGHIHCARDVVAAPKFGGLRGYRIADTGEIYASREEAEAALCAARQARVTSPTNGREVTS